MKSKRNDPCHCGSGKKYKKCCMQTEMGLSGDDILRVLRQLCPSLEKAGREQYGESVDNAAWEDFSRWGLEAIAREEQAYKAAFSDWYLYAWLPDDTALGRATFTSALSDHPIAADFLKANRRELGPVEQGVIDVATTAPYSFYTVTAVAEDDRLRLREIYTEQDVVVESVGNRSFAEGDVLYCTVVGVNGVSVLLGCMPNVLSANEQATIEAHREKWKAEEGGKLDRRLLYLHDTELRRLYFMLLSKAQKARLH